MAINAFILNGKGKFKTSEVLPHNSEVLNAWSFVTQIIGKSKLEGFRLFN